MTLGRLAAAIRAPRKWVLNAHALLGLDSSYTVERAQVLALTRLLEQTFHMTLGRAYEFARTTLRNPDAPASWRHESPDGAVAVVIDRDRFLSNFAASLSHALVGYAERRRGRPAKKRRRGVAHARAHGVDIGLLRESLKRTPAARLRHLDEDAAFVTSLKTRTP